MKVSGHRFKWEMRKIKCWNRLLTEILEVSLSLTVFKIQTKPWTTWSGFSCVSVALAINLMGGGFSLRLVLPTMSLNYSDTVILRWMLMLEHVDQKRARDGMFTPSLSGDTSKCFQKSQMWLWVSWVMFPSGIPLRRKCCIKLLES